MRGTTRSLRGRGQSPSRWAANSSGKARRMLRITICSSVPQVAAVGVGDLGEPGADHGDVLVGAPAGLDLVQAVGDLLAAELARRALAARLHVQEPRELERHLHHARGLVVDGVAGGAHPAADGGHGLVGHGRPQLVGGDHRVGHAREHGLDRHGPDPAARRRPARSPRPAACPGRPRRTPGRATSPTTVITWWPGESVGAHACRNHSAPRARMWGTLASVSTLLARVGFDRWASAWPGSGVGRLPAHLGRGGEQAVLVGRQDPGHRRAALDHLEQRLLLAEEVLVGALDDRDAARRRPSPRPRISSMARSRRHDLGCEPGLDADVDLPGPDGEGGDGQPLDHLVGVGPHDGPVLERGRLALGRVAHHVAVGAAPGCGSRPTCARSGSRLRPVPAVPDTLISSIVNSAPSRRAASSPAPPPNARHPATEVTGSSGRR